MYGALLAAFGEQHWWPAETRFEVLAGAILTQQASWANVEKSIALFKRAGMLDAKRIAAASSNTLEALAYPTGFYRQKAKRLKRFAQYLVARCDADLDAFFSQPLHELRAELLSLDGIGPETADSMLLYAGGKLVFPIDAYTQRVCERCGMGRKEYSKLQCMFEEQLPRSVAAYKNAHALIVELAKRYCKAKPLCGGCPLREGKICRYADGSSAKVRATA
jgi:endonuclease-3 related protein